MSIDFAYTQLTVKTVLYQTIQYSVSTVSMSKTVPLQTIQFSISTQFSSIWSTDRTLSDATIPGQSRPGSDGSEGVLRIPQNSSITAVSLSDYFVSYPGHSFGGGGLTPLKRCSQCILLTGQTYDWYLIESFAIFRNLTI